MEIGGAGERVSFEAFSFPFVVGLWTIRFVDERESFQRPLDTNGRRKRGIQRTVMSFGVGAKIVRQ